jgi:hypothetical protein
VQPGDQVPFQVERDTDIITVVVHIGSASTLLFAAVPSASILTPAAPTPASSAAKLRRASWLNVACFFSTGAAGMTPTQIADLRRLARGVVRDADIKVRPDCLPPVCLIASCLVLAWLADFSTLLRALALCADPSFSCSVSRPMRPFVAARPAARLPALLRAPLRAEPAEKTCVLLSACCVSGRV